MRGRMAFALWSYVPHGGVTAARDGLAMVMLHGSSSILVRFASVGELAYLFESPAGSGNGRVRRIGFYGALAGMPFVRPCTNRRKVCFL